MVTITRTKYGDTSRLYHVMAHSTVAVDSHMQGHSKHRELGRKRPAREEWFGHDFYHKEQRWSVLRRTLDRAHNWYCEIIIDLKTGRLRRLCSEPLKKHRDRGSAKPRRT